jgi:hypothetical protein
MLNIDLSGVKKWREQDVEKVEIIKTCLRALRGCGEGTVWLWRRERQVTGLLPCG